MRVDSDDDFETHIFFILFIFVFMCTGYMYLFENKLLIKSLKQFLLNIFNFHITQYATTTLNIWFRHFETSC